MSEGGNTVSSRSHRLSPRQQITQYLQLLVRCHANHPGLSYAGPGDWLLTHGRFWKLGTKPIKQMMPSRCFQNAFVLASRSKGRLRYVEGVALSVIPLDHAWCVDENDCVVDPTWEVGHGKVYFGAVFTLPDLRQLRRESRQVSMIWDYERRFPLLRKPKGSHEQTPTTD